VTNLMRAEWIKFRSVRSTVITLLIAGALVVLVAVLTAVNIDDETSIRCDPVSSETETTTTVPGVDGGEDFGNPCPDGLQAVPDAHNLTDLTVGVSLACLLFGVLGVQVIGQEYRFNTIRPTFTAAPRRLPVVLAKLIVVCASCGIVAAVMVAFCWVVGSTMLDAFTVDGVDQRAALGIVLFGALWTAAGLGVGAIVRQPIAGILILVAESLILESIIGAVFESTQKWLPFANGLQMTYRADGEAESLQSVLNGGIYFAVFCVILVAIGAILVQRRDA
jgi:ABC-2 type transport system permease protein